MQNENDPNEMLYSGAIDSNDLAAHARADVDEAYEEQVGIDEEDDYEFDEEDGECVECGSEFCEGDCVDYDRGPVVAITYPPPRTYTLDDAIAELRRITGAQSALDYIRRPGRDIDVQFDHTGELMAYPRNRPVPSEGVRFDPTPEDRAATDWILDAYF